MILNVWAMMRTKMKLMKKGGRSKLRSLISSKQIKQQQNLSSKFYQDSLMHLEIW